MDSPSPQRTDSRLALGLHAEDNPVHRIETAYDDIDACLDTAIGQTEAIEAEETGFKGTKTHQGGDLILGNSATRAGEKQSVLLILIHIQI